MAPSGSLAGRAALITGGGTGIGRATALVLAGEGASVAVNYSRSAAEADETVRELEARGVAALAVKADVSKDEEVRAMVGEVERRLGQLDILVNSAGTTTFVPFSDLDALTEEMWDRVWDVNVKGAFFCARAAAPLLRGSGRGVILNVASVAGITGYGSSMAYAASKAAMISLTKSLARALAPSVRVNAVAPGFVDSRWTAGQEQYRQKHLELTPLGRVARPEDVAEVALSLIAGAGLVTGQVVVVDGGRIL